MNPGATNHLNVVRKTAVLFNVLCGVTNGYDISVAAVMLNNIASDFGFCGGGTIEDLQKADCFEKQAVLSMVAAGQVCGKLFLSWVADRFGRRLALAVVDILLLSGVALQCVASCNLVFFLGRFMSGLGLGFAFVVEPSYVCEIAPPSLRGTFIVLNEFAVCAGYLLGLHITTAMKLRHVPWRTAVILCACPPLLQLLVLPFLPESPRWLAIQGDSAGFKQSASALGLTQNEIDVLNLQIQHEVSRKAPEGSRGLWQSLDTHFKAWGTHSRAIFISMGFVSFTTASGIYGMQAYAPAVLRLCGVNEPAKWQPLVGWMKLGGAFVAVVGSDASCLGRRRLSVACAIGCCLCQLLIALHVSAAGTVSVMASSLAFFLFIFFWNAGYGGLQFVVTMELLPNEVRSTWAGQIYAWCGILDVLIYQFFLSLINASGTATFLVFGFINLSSAMFAACFLPELRGRSLEEASAQIAQRPSQPGPNSKQRRYATLEEEAMDQLQDLRERPAAPSPHIVGSVDKEMANA